RSRRGAAEPRAGGGRVNPPVAREKPETAPCTVCGQEADALVRICEKCDARWRGDEGMLDIRPVPSAAANTDSDPDAAPAGDALDVATVADHPAREIIHRFQ